MPHNLCVRNNVIISWRSKIIRFLLTLVYNPGWSGAAQTPPQETAPYNIGSFSSLMQISGPPESPWHASRPPLRWPKTDKKTVKCKIWTYLRKAQLSHHTPDRLICKYHRWWYWREWTWENQTTRLPIQQFQNQQRNISTVASIP